VLMTVSGIITEDRSEARFNHLAAVR
jgi:hypothetical protein